MLDGYLNEYEQWDALKRWWEKYNAIVVVLFSLVLLSLSAYKYWNWHQQQKSLQASNTYEHMMLAAANHQTKLLRSYALDLVKNYPETIYSDAARLSLAKLAVNHHQYAIAEQELQKVVSNSHIPELIDVAKIRLARLWFVQKKYDRALQMLQGMNSKVYLPLVDELRGDIYTGMDQFDQAVKFYRKALSEVQNYGVGNLFLEMKSNDLSAVSGKPLVSQGQLALQN